MVELHRLLGLALTDFFTGSAYRVELEKDLSLKKQMLDVMIIEQEAGGPTPELPDGLENLARHNLLTYKSPHQALDSWSLDELLGHYVNYRKQSSPSLDELFPVEDFRLYAVSTRQPEKLATEVLLSSLKDGVYETKWGTHEIRIIVLSQIPKIERNAIWQMFSGVVEKVQYGAAHYHWRQSNHSTVINELFQYYQVEGIAMPYTWDDYYVDFTKRHLDRLSKDDLLAKLTIEDRLKGLPVEDRLKGLPVEDRLKGLSPKAIEAYLRKLPKRQRKTK